VQGEISYILPCLAHIETATQASGPQAVSMEDCTGCMHSSRVRQSRRAHSCFPNLRSSLNSPRRRCHQVRPFRGTNGFADYFEIRDSIAATYPEIFHEFTPSSSRAASTPQSKRSIDLRSERHERPAQARIRRTAPPDRPAADPSSIQVSRRRNESVILLGFNSGVFQHNPPEAAIHPGPSSLRSDNKRQKATRALHRMAFARLSP
jgi:hypothetical protein